MYSLGSVEKERVMPRKKIDLKELPLYLRYLIAITVTALIVGLVYLEKNVQPAPYWIQEYVIEKPDVTAVVLVVLFAFVWVVRWLFR